MKIGVKMNNSNILKWLKRLFSKQPKQITYRSTEIGSELVRISHKITSTSSKPQLIKIGDKYFNVRELG